MLDSDTATRTKLNALLHCWESKYPVVLWDRVKSVCWGRQNRRIWWNLATCEGGQGQWVEIFFWYYYNRLKGRNGRVVGGIETLENDHWQKEHNEILWFFDTKNGMVEPTCEKAPVVEASQAPAVKFLRMDNAGGNKELHKNAHTEMLSLSCWWQHIGHQSLLRIETP